MNKLHLLTPTCLSLLSLFALPLQADEKSMNEALAQWEQEQSEYRAALKVTTDEAERQKLLSSDPRGSETAKKLWKAIFYKTGTREVTEASTAPSSRFDKPKTKKIAVYAYEEPWAAPAVAWLLSNPETLYNLVAKQQVSHVAAALLSTIEKTHYKHPSMAQICAPLSALSSLQAYECLKKIYFNNPDARARANAAIGLSIMLDKAQIRSVEGSEEMADAKRIDYIKNALNIAPEGCMFGNKRIEEVAIELVHNISKLSPGRIPPQVTVVENGPKGKSHTFPTSLKAQILLFWSPLNSDSIALMLRAQELADKYPNIDIIPICAKCEPEALSMAYENEGIQMPTYLDQTGTAFGEYRIQAVPTVALISHKSQLIYLGYPDFNFQAKINAYLQSLEAQPSAPAPAAPAEPRTQAEDEGDSQAPPLREIPAL